MERVKLALLEELRGSRKVKEALAKPSDESSKIIRRAAMAILCDDRHDLSKRVRTRVLFYLRVGGAKARFIINTNW